jgi:predicted hotdog family 3-hydroxylacyl-ACP dehydratase
MNPEVLPKSQWGHLIPHQGAMCLLDAVIAWDASTLHARTASHRRADNPLRDGAQLRAVHLAEYGAQAMAVHGALCAQAAGGAAQPGFLVSLRGVRFAVARIDDLAGDLDVYGEKLLDNGSSWQYAFRIEHEGNVIAEGRAAVMVGAG